MTRNPDDPGENEPDLHGQCLVNDHNTSHALRDRIDELQDFYDFSPVGYLTLDPKGRILSVNLTLLIMLKAAKSELIGQSFYDYLDSEYRDILFLHLRGLFKNKTPDRCELRIQNADNSKTIHIIQESIYAEDMRGGGVCRSALINITDRIHAETALRESEEKLRIVIDSGRLGTWDRNLVNDHVTWNPYLYELLGRALDGPPVTGETFFTYIHPDDIERVRQHFDEKYRTGTDFYDEFRVIREDGKIRWLTAAGRVYRDSKEKPVRMAGVNFDITHWKLMEEEIRKSRDELEIHVKERTVELEKTNDKLKDYNWRLEELNRELQDFTFIASHDLQEPLRKIRTFGEMLYSRSKESLDEASGDYLKRMLNAAIRMQKLLYSLLIYSRVTTKVEPIKETNLGKSVEVALSNLEIMIEEKHARVEIGDLPTVMADRIQIIQLFQNLIGNALKFQRKGETPHVKIYAQEADGKNRTYDICVEDNGIGMDERYLDKIFLPFQRLHGKDEYDGVGMGLTICNKIVKRHGGKITARTEIGKGSIFIVTLPA